VEGHSGPCMIFHSSDRIYNLHEVVYHHVYPLLNMDISLSLSLFIFGATYVLHVWVVHNNDRG
jgi:hypothetical protein